MGMLISGHNHDQMRTKSQGLALCLIVKVIPAVEAQAKKRLKKKEGERHINMQLLCQQCIELVNHKAF